MPTLYSSEPSKCSNCKDHSFEFMESVSVGMRQTKGWVCNSCGWFHEFADPVELPEEFKKQLPDAAHTQVMQSAIRGIIGEKKEGELQKFLVAVQSIDRRYGGAEEGGWWYDWRSTDSVHRCYGKESLLSLLNDLKGNNPQPRFNRFSVIGGADVEFVVCTEEEEFQELETKSRPRYE